MLSPEEEAQIRRIITKNQEASAPAAVAAPQSTLPLSAEAQIAQILGQAGDESAVEISAEDAAEFRKKFSWGALFYNVVYYYKTKDWVFFWISLVASLSVYLLPVLIPLSFFARRRAWTFGKWDNEHQFESAQKRWDRNGWIGAVFTGILLIFAFHFIFNMLSGGLGTSNPNQILNQVQGEVNGTGS